LLAGILSSGNPKRLLANTWNESMSPMIKIIVIRTSKKVGGVDTPPG